MIQSTEFFPISQLPAYWLEQAPTKPVLFDIETTGLSARFHYVILIGCARPVWDGQTCTGYELLQWFAQTPEEESSLLDAFLSVLTPDVTLHHFNGQTFDIPFLQKRCALHRIDCHLDAAASIDWLRVLAPLRQIYHLQGCRLKQLEAFAGFSRTDELDGKELISHYSSFIGRSRFDEEGATALRSRILQHNRDDIAGLAALAGLLGAASLTNAPVTKAWADFLENQLDIHAVLSRPVLQPLKIAPTAELPASLTIEGTEARLTLPYLDGEFYYYLENYKDYYYLPEEGLCIYRSLAASVPASRRVPCTRLTARLRAEAPVVFQPGRIVEPCLMDGNRSATCYFSVRENTLLEQLVPYCNQLLRTMLLQKNPET